MSKTEKWLAYAYRNATESHDTSNQNGAVLIEPDGSVAGVGRNDFPPGVEFTQERATTRPKKYRYFEHAERNAIYAAACRGYKVLDSTMYVPWAACCDCARGIIISGVSTVVMHSERMQMTPERWQSSVNEALSMLKEAGVTLEYYEGPIQDVPDVLVNGVFWNPADPPMLEGLGNFQVAMGEVR